MNDSREHGRINVVWRGAIQLAPGKIVAIKILNFSRSGILIESNQMLKDGQTYNMMMEVPDPRDGSQRTQVVCKCKCAYCLLSANHYRCGMRYFDVPEQHDSLLESWYPQQPSFDL